MVKFTWHENLVAKMGTKSIGVNCPKVFIYLSKADLFILDKQEMLTIR